jgi:arginine repressor
MARSVRQSKILELISTKEIETQDDLVANLRAANFDITQATISRDIKELGLIKILSAETGKYKYALVDSEEQAISNKYISIFREAVISIKTAQNLVVLKTIRHANSLWVIVNFLKFSISQCEITGVEYPNRRSKNHNECNKQLNSFLNFKKN